MWQVVKRDVRFWIGITFLSVLMIVSIGYTLFFDGNIRELTMMYNEKGELEAAPFAPSSKFWFGSDVKGRDLVQLINNRRCKMDSWCKYNYSDFTSYSWRGNWFTSWYVW